MSALWLGPLSNQCSLFHVDAGKLNYLDAYTEDKETMGNKNQLPQKKGGKKENFGRHTCIADTEHDQMMLTQNAGNTRGPQTPGVNTTKCWSRQLPPKMPNVIDGKGASTQRREKSLQAGHGMALLLFFPLFRRRSKQRAAAGANPPVKFSQNMTKIN